MAVLLHLQMRLHDGVADALLGQAQTLADTSKQDEAEQVGAPPPLLPLGPCAPSGTCVPSTHCGALCGTAHPDHLGALSPLQSRWSSCIVSFPSKNLDPECSPTCRCWATRWQRRRAWAGRPTRAWRACCWSSAACTPAPRAWASPRACTGAADCIHTVYPICHAVHTFERRLSPWTRPTLPKSAQRMEQQTDVMVQQSTNRLRLDGHQHHAITAGSQ